MRNPAKQHSRSQDDGEDHIERRDDHEKDVQNPPNKCQILDMIDLDISFQHALLTTQSMSTPTITLTLTALTDKRASKSSSPTMPW